MSIKFFINTQVNEIKTVHVKWSCTQLSMEKNVLQPKSIALDIFYFSKYLPHSHFIMYQA